MAKFTHLIFDLGNVIIDIDYMRPIMAFQQLVPAGSSTNFSQVVSYTAQHGFFDDFEKGKISVPHFREELRRFLKPNVTDAEIDDAWNSIMVDYPAAKINLLKQLKTRYRSVALSNINRVHVDTINRAAQSLFGAQAFADFFHAAYYSNEIGFRKPQKEIYEYVLLQENLNPAQAFFVDDKAENVEAARQLGLQAYQLKPPGALMEMLSELEII